MQGITVPYGVGDEAACSIIIVIFIHVIRIVSIKGIRFPARIKAKNFLILFQILFKESNDFLTVE
ncbi:hypothetical protein D3C78_1988950 [compost metagenome]